MIQISDKHTAFIIKCGVHDRAFHSVPNQLCRPEKWIFINFRKIRENFGKGFADSLTILQPSVAKARRWKSELNLEKTLPHRFPTGTLLLCSPNWCPLIVAISGVSRSFRRAAVWWGHGCPVSAPLTVLREEKGDGDEPQDEKADKRSKKDPKHRWSHLWHWKKSWVEIEERFLRCKPGSTNRTEGCNARD